MLTEFAFTPAIFDEDAHENPDRWLGQLQDLARGLFPHIAPCSSIVANLGGGGWKSEVVNVVKNAKHPAAKLACQSLLTQIDRILVDRALRGEWPGDDVDWGREAVACHAVEPLDRIVASPTTRATIGNNCIRSIDEVSGAGFWRGVGTAASPKMVVNEQVGLLRKICVHSEWIALINPYCCTSEHRHCLELILANLSAPSQLGPRLIELHAEAKDGADEATRQSNLVSRVDRAVKAQLLPGQSVSIFFWPRLRERLFIAGRFARESGGTLRKSPRWGVSMNHVVQEVDYGDDKTHWSLLSREDTGYWFDKHISENAVSLPVPVCIANP